METLFTPEILTTLFGGAVITLLVNLVKGKLGKFNTQYVVLVLSVVLGGAYMGFKNFLPETFQTAFVNYVGQTLAFAVVIYEFVWKNLTTTNTTDTTK